MILQIQLASDMSLLLIIQYTINRKILLGEKIPQNDCRKILSVKLETDA